MTDSQAGAEAASDSDGLPGPTAALAALLAALGLGAGAYATMRTRRRRREERRAYDTGPGPDPVPGIDGPRMASNEPTGGLEPELPLPAYAAIEDAADAPVAPERVAVGMTTEPLPRTREARDALLDKMVSAPPDAENPFTSRKGRMRRARLILQALEHNQKEAASQPFDWRTYKPSTSNPAPATPPRVTA